MKTYKYQGPIDSGVTLDIDGRAQDVLLFRGKEVDLPENHSYVQTLVALGHLVPVAATMPTSPAAAEPETAKKGGK